jgi:putative transposase
MSSPRQVLPGATYLITRRCTQRQFLLRPCDQTNNILRYCLALDATRFPVELHAFCFLSNHMHLVATDPTAILPEFMRYLDEMIARAVNASHGRCENLWARGSYSFVRLVDAQDIIDKTAYTLANPVTAGLVARSRHWPGVISDTRNVDGSPIMTRRPEAFFRQNGPTPEFCALRLTRPPGFATTADFVEPVERELRARENAATANAREHGGDFLGVRAVLRQDPTDSPRTSEPRGGLSPSIACHDRSRRIEALRLLKEFLDSYRRAWRDFCSGVRDVFFPAGTYMLRVQLGVRVACGPP